MRFLAFRLTSPPPPGEGFCGCGPSAASPSGSWPNPRTRPLTSPLWNRARCAPPRPPCGTCDTTRRQLADEPATQRVPAVRGRAAAHRLSGELRYACYLSETTLDELNASGLHDPDALLLLYTASIAPCLDMGARARAGRAAELALTLAPQVDDPALLAGMRRGVARTHIAQGRIAEAGSSPAKAQELCRQLHIRTDLAHCH